MDAELAAGCRLYFDSRGSVEKEDRRTAPFQSPVGFPDIDITHLHYDSRKIAPGGLFVAIQGFAVDGHDYIQDAVQRGAVAVVTQKPVACRALCIEVPDTRKVLAVLSDSFYGHPSGRVHIIGITGTNGKTTTAYLVEAILAAAGKKVGVIGTVNYRYGGKSFTNPITTPESLDLQRILAEMVSNAVTHVVMEVSSHAVDLFRIHRCEILTGVFTNLTQDHLDYHGSMEKYWACKKRFFTRHIPMENRQSKGAAVVNIDDERGKEIIDAVPYPCITVGSSPKSNVRPTDTAIDLTGIRGRLKTPHGDIAFVSRLIGAYNLENILCAAGVAVALDLPLNTIRTGIEKTKAIPGRLEQVGNGSQKSVYVDFAHTPDALKNVLTALKCLNPRRMICVFGCGGDRDKAKRPLMGEIAGSLCDLVVVTSDNPRTEPPKDIVSQILAGVERTCPHEYRLKDIQQGFRRKGHIAEPDRRHAIGIGIAAADPGDIVLIAGKGHETYQIIGHRRLPFDDRTTARSILAGTSAELRENTNAADTLQGDRES